MPPTTYIRTFLETIRTGKTNTMEALDILFGNAVAVRGHPSFADLQKPGALNVLDTWARAELRRLGLSSAELTHIDAWDNNQKELVRQAFVDAANNNLPVEFFWRLSTGATEDISIVPGPPKVTVTFYSPESRVRVPGPDNVVVDVGP